MTNPPQFLPNLPTLRYQLESAAAQEEFASTHLQLALLPYCLGATYRALVDFVEAEAELVRAHPPKDPRAIIAVGAGGRDKLGYRIDTFLESARRTQNALIPYIGKALRVSLPASLDDVVKRLEKQPDLLTPALREETIAYWSNHGGVLKDYRDLSQHYALVASEVRIFQSSAGQPAIYMTLPNNPEAKAVTKLVFDQPTIIAYVFMKRQLHALIRFCHAVTTALTIPPQGDLRTASVGIVFRSPAQVGEGAQLEGHHLVSAETVRAEVEQLVAEWRPL